MEPADFDRVLATVREFVRDRVMPLEAEIEDKDEMPAEVRQTAKDIGLFGFAIPEEYGGLGLSMYESARLVMELGYTTPALRSMVGTNNGIAGQTLLAAGTNRQQRSWLPRIASGEVTASFALTEAEAGSDPASLTTSARRTTGGWLLNGAKRFITNAPLADLFMTYARTNPDADGTHAISAFLVPRDVAGLTIGPRDHKMGQFGAWTADVYFHDVFVPDEALVGEESGLDTGFATAMKCLVQGRIHIAALCVGLAGRLVDESVDHARTRQQGGRPIARFQLVQGLIADSVTEMFAARSLVLDVARAFDAGTDTRLGPSCAKYFASEMVGRVADRAVQVYGGAGYIRGVAVERFYRDARLFRIYEGTSQVQQVIIARQLLGDAARE